VAFPVFVDKAVAIVPTPRMTASDLLLWQTELDLLESFSGSTEDLRKALRVAGQIQSLELWTPSWLARSWKVEETPKRIEERRRSFDRLDPYDYMSQLRAMIAHNVYRRFDDSAERAAKSIRARMLIVVASQDQMVNPGPAIELAKLTGAQLLTLGNDCGHLAPGCEWDVVTKAVQEFLK
jgi:homoserine O-acetyltransferase/O-succinyltransferase